MTFPRPCLYALLAACLLLPGCVANQYAIKINAITNGDIQAGIGDVYYIMAVKGQEDDLVFLELKRNLESALPQAGLDVTAIVVTGDISQIDLPRGESGLVQVRSVLEGIDDIAFCDLSGKDVVRHSLVATIVAAYERAAGKAR